MFDFFFFFFNDPATTEIYTLSLHDALPIWSWRNCCSIKRAWHWWPAKGSALPVTCGSPTQHPSNGSRKGCAADRKSTRLNSSHSSISYAVFCLKKKKKKKQQQIDKQA